MVKQLLALLGVLLLIPSFAQIRVVHVEDDAAQSTAPGVYYALPKTFLKFDVTVVKTEVVPGPYHEFAEEMLGLEDVPYSGSEEYAIRDVALEDFARPDPEQFYFVEYGEKALKEEKQLMLSLSEAGMITGFNTTGETPASQNVMFPHDLDGEPEYKYFQYVAESNLYEKVDTMVRKITIDTLTIEKEFYKTSWAQKADRQKARDAVDFLERIRENRFLLISGYQEVNYGESIKYMDEQLQRLEKEYLSLFTGVTITTVYRHSYIFVPDKEETSVVLFRFSSSRGVIPAGQSGGENVSVEIIPTGSSEKISAFVQSKNKHNPLGNSIYYRIPEFADLELVYRGESLFKSNLQISQLGLVTYAPVYEPGIEFYPETGGVKKIDIEVK